MACRSRGVQVFFLLYAEGTPDMSRPPLFIAVTETSARYLVYENAPSGLYAVTVETAKMGKRTGAVNYLDYLIFSATVFKFRGYV